RKHRRCRTGADVRAEADCDAGAERVVEAEQAAAEEKVRVRTVRNARAAVGEQLQLLFRQMNAVREDASLVEQPVAVVNIRILGLGEELMDPLNFVAVLGDMRVDVCVWKLPLELTRRFE